MKMFQIIHFKQFMFPEVTENLYSRVISPLLKFGQIRDVWIKTGIVSRHFKALETP